MKIKRHSLIVRLTHWANALILLVMLLSGLQIFNAHPALYLGHKSTFDRPLLSIDALQSNDGSLTGQLNAFGAKVDTTGFLGASKDQQGMMQARPFPPWLTLPTYQDLAQGRRWHFFFAWLLVANGAIYLAHALLTKHVTRNLLPTRAQLKGIGADIVHHLQLRFPKGEAARHYNALQKLAYLGVIFVLGPLVVVTGMTMSPGLNAAFPFLVDLFGGRQTARTLHFVCAFGFVAFVAIHVLLVLLSGVWNNLRSMITGEYELGAEKKA